MSLTPGQQTVLQAFSDFGEADDTTLSVYVHHVAEVSMSSSGIRTRRNELVRKGLVSLSGIKKLKSGRHAAIYRINRKGQTALRQATRASAALAA